MTSNVQPQTLERPVVPPLAKISDGAFKPVGGDKAYNANKEKNVATTLDRAAGKALATKVIKATTRERGQWLDYIKEAQDLTNEGRAEVLGALSVYLEQQRESAKERGRTDDERKQYAKDARVWAVNLSNFRRVVEAMTACGLTATLVADKIGKTDASEVTFADWRNAARDFLASHAEGLRKAAGKPGRPTKTVAEKLKTYLEKIGGDMATDAAACAKVLRDAATALTAKPKGDTPAAA